MLLTSGTGLASGIHHHKIAQQDWREGRSAHWYAYGKNIKSLQYEALPKKIILEDLQELNPPLEIF